MNRDFYLNSGRKAAVNNQPQRSDPTHPPTSIHDDTARFDYRRVWLDGEIAELRERNAKRVKAAIEALGTKYICHPANRVKRNPVRPSILSTFSGVPPLDYALPMRGGAVDLVALGQHTD